MSKNWRIHVAVLMQKRQENNRQYVFVATQDGLMMDCREFDALGELVADTAMVPLPVELEVNPSTSTGSGVCRLRGKKVCFAEN
jgi:hypothetical protein